VHSHYRQNHNNSPQKEKIPGFGVVLFGFLDHFSDQPNFFFDLSVVHDASIDNINNKVLCLTKIK
jgi:hypothetical protein